MLQYKSNKALFKKKKNFKDIIFKMNDINCERSYDLYRVSKIKKEVSKIKKEVSFFDGRRNYEILRIYRKITRNQ